MIKKLSHRWQQRKPTESRNGFQKTDERALPLLNFDLIFNC